MHRSLSRALLACLLAPLALAQEPQPDPRKQALESLTTARLRAHVDKLADDDMEGRLSGSINERRAASYVSDHLAKAGLSPAGDDGGWTQRFSLGETLIVERRRCALTVTIGDKAHELQVERDWMPLSCSADAEGEGELVFVGYGISAPELRYDDYADVDVRGKVVVAMRGAPRADSRLSPFVRGRAVRHSFFVNKALLAQRRGARALVLVSPPSTTPPERDGLVALNNRRDDASVIIPVLHARLRVAAPWFAAAGGEPLARRQQLIDKLMKPRSAALGGRAEVKADIGYGSRVSQNVLGLLKGSDPQLSREIVVIGAHYDHVGRGSIGSLGGRLARGRIHNGADDNASGTAVLIELAYAFQRAKIQPKRTILFIAFGAEERGLLGSRHYVRYPIVPLQRHVAMINMDMVGRGVTGYFMIKGTATSPSWEPLLDELGKELPGSPRRGESGNAPSDSNSFFERGVPVLFFFSGLHHDYHRPGDDTEHLNGKQHQLIARWTFASLFALACERRPRPRFRRGSFERKAPPFLGVAQGSRAAKGYAVRYVVAGSSAAAAGVEAGDVIVKLDGAEVRGALDLTRVLSRLRIGQRVVITVRRDERTLELPTTLTARP